MIFSQCVCVLLISCSWICPSVEFILLLSILTVCSSSVFFTYRQCQTVFANKRWPPSKTTLQAYSMHKHIGFLKSTHSFHAQSRLEFPHSRVCTLHSETEWAGPGTALSWACLVIYLHSESLGTERLGPANLCSPLTSRRPRVALWGMTVPFNNLQWSNTLNAVCFCPKTTVPTTQAVCLRYYHKRQYM